MTQKKPKNISDKQKIDELNQLVKARANERYILSKLKAFRYKEIGDANIKILLECFQWKDMIHNKKYKINMTSISMDCYEGQPYETFIEFFNRWLTKVKFEEIKESSSKHAIILPSESNIESIGRLKDTSSILRLKKKAPEVIDDLKELGIEENYAFVNMKLLISYYHHVHAPVSGKIKRMMPIEYDNHIFGKNTLWFLEFETAKKPVYLLIVGESSIQDFNFLVKKNDVVNIADDLGYFTWGSQVVLLFDIDSYLDNILIQPNHHYFVGTPIILQ